MTDQSMFDNDNKPGETPPISQASSAVDKLMAIKNERGEPKYKSVEDALDALAASQQFIETLKTEKKTVQEQLELTKAELAQKATLEDFVKKLKPNAAPEPKSETPAKDAGLSEERVAQLLETALERKAREAQEQQNLALVINKLSEQHGDKAAAFIKQRATELNTTPDALKALAKANPLMATTLLGVVSKPSAPPSQSSMSRVPDSQSQPNTIKTNLARGGVSNKELAAHFKASKDLTNKRLGLET